MTWAPSVKQLTVLQQGGGFYPNACEWTDSIILNGSAKTDYDLTAARVLMGVPVGAPLFCQIAADGPFYMNVHAAAVVPVTSTTDGTAAVGTPTQRYLDGSVTTISLIAGQAAVVTLSFYRT